MRSIALILAFAAPLSAVAAPNTFTRPTRMHEQKPQTVFMTFVNYTPQDREVQIGNVMYKIQYDTVAHFYAPVGSTVRVFSKTNSKINGQELIQVTAADRDRSIILK